VRPPELLVEPNAEPNPILELDDDEEELPEELRKMNTGQLNGYVQQKKREREEVKAQITELSRKRDAYILQKQKQNAGEQSLGSVILKNLRAQAEAKNFRFK